MSIEKQFKNFLSPDKRPKDRKSSIVSPEEQHPDLKQLVQKLKERLKDYSLLVGLAPKKIKKLKANLLLTNSSVLGSSLKYSFYPYTSYPLIYRSAEQFMKKLRIYGNNRNNNQSARIFILFEGFQSKLKSEEITIEGVKTEMEELITQVCEIK